MLWRRRKPSELQAPVPHGSAGIETLGPRDYVGGLWDEIGRLQLDFLRDQGLRPDHVLLDIGCGSLRGGVHLIPYLDRGHYLGIDKEQSLIDHGLNVELPADLRVEKAPELIVSDEFEFHRFTRQPDFAIAQSLFTHLPPRLILKCMRRLRRVAPRECRFYATFFEATERAANPRQPHDHVNWWYTRHEMGRFGRRSGWEAKYIGEWGHPRGQMMLLLEPRRRYLRT